MRAYSIESAISDEIASERYSCAAIPFRFGDFTRVAMSCGFTQGVVDVHGSHELFYWTRSRGRGWIVLSDSAAVVMHYSADMERIVLIRPIGALRAIIELIKDVCTAVTVACGGPDVVVRYCSSELAREFRQIGSRSLSRPLLPSTFADDETWPEVIINGTIDDYPSGREYKPIRKAINRYAETHEYFARDRLLHCGEALFILSRTSRTEVSDEYEKGFNDALVSFLSDNEVSDLMYHYLFAGSNMEGFAVTGNITGISHCYYSGVRKLPRLSTYFLWKIFQNERAGGAEGLNLGGSEEESLFRYKEETFHNHAIRVTKPVVLRLDTRLRSALGGT